MIHLDLTLPPHSLANTPPPLLPFACSFRKAELKTFLQFHREGTEPLRDDEITILNGVLSLNEKKASQIMTPIKVSSVASSPSLSKARAGTMVTLARC